MSGRGEELREWERKIAQAEKATEEAEKLERLLQELNEDNRRLRNELAAAQQAVAAPKRVGGKRPESDTSVPEVSQTAEKSLKPSTLSESKTSDSSNEVNQEWIDKWKKSDAFERDWTVLKLIGDTGISRRPVIESKLAESFGIKRPGGSINALFNRLSEKKLIDIFLPWLEAGQGIGGNHPDMIRLTGQGAAVYRLITGEPPKECEYDALIGVHKTPEHTLLNLWARDILTAARYRIISDAPEILLPGGGKFQPDIAASDESGTMIYVEVERNVRKREERKAKWENAWTAGGGQIYAICDNRDCMRTIRNEINFIMGGRPSTLHLSNVNDIQAGKRGEGESIWLEVRKRDPGH
jgi:hypothetical protein